jgi:addiction module RelE/StbE family toxin
LNLRLPLEIKQALRETLELFLENPTHEALRNHPLTEEYAGTWSIDVTADWRALYRKDQGKIIFVKLGTHDELYG